MLYSEIFTVVIPVEKEVFGYNHPRNIDSKSFSIALHSRHTVGADDGSYINQEKKCLNTLLSLSDDDADCFKCLHRHRHRCPSFRKDSRTTSSSSAGRKRFVRLSNSLHYSGKEASAILFICVHDPAWWWVKASNLETPSGVVVRFNLAHVFCSLLLDDSLTLCPTF